MIVKNNQSTKIQREKEIRVVLVGRRRIYEREIQESHPESIPWPKPEAIDEVLEKRTATSLSLFQVWFGLAWCVCVRARASGMVALLGFPSAQEAKWEGPVKMKIRKKTVGGRS